MTHKGSFLLKDKCDLVYKKKHQRKNGSIAGKQADVFSMIREKKILKKGHDRKDVKMRDVVYEQLLWMLNMFLSWEFFFYFLFVLIQELLELEFM